jgi:hypothetical protein
LLVKAAGMEAGLQSEHYLEFIDLVSVGIVAIVK